MSSNGLVSIIVPVYNAENYLKYCIESILLQTYNNIEIILVNDGSTDYSGEICEQYSYKDPRVKTIHQMNMGPSVARNNGILHSTGSYIQFLDADDQIDISMVKELVNHIKKADLVISGYRSVLKNNRQNVSEEVKPSSNDYFTKKEFLQIFPDLFKKNLINPSWNKLYNASIIKNNKLSFDEGIHNGEDLLFNLKYLHYCNHIKLVDNSLYLYIKDNNTFSLTKKYKSNYVKNRKVILKDLNNFLSSYQDITPQNKKLIKETSANYFIQSLSNIYSNENFRSYKHRSKEINVIINSDWAKNVMRSKAYSLEGRIIIILVKYQSPLLIDLYFQLKFFFKENFRIGFRFLRKLN